MCETALKKKKFNQYLVLDSLSIFHNHVQGKTLGCMTKKVSMINTIRRSNLEFVVCHHICTYESKEKHHHLEVFWGAREYRATGFGGFCFLSKSTPRVYSGVLYIFFLLRLLCARRPRNTFALREVMW